MCFMSELTGEEEWTLTLPVEEDRAEHRSKCLYDDTKIAQSGKVTVSGADVDAQVRFGIICKVSGLVPSFEAQHQAAKQVCCCCCSWLFLQLWASLCNKVSWICKFWVMSANKSIKTWRVGSNTDLFVGFVLQMSTCPWKPQWAAVSNCITE